jgi:ComF family protein
MLNFLIELLFPAKCAICNSYASKSDICSECWSKFTFITKPCCSICSYPFAFEEDKNAICGYCIINKPNYDRAISVLKYDAYSKNLIHKFKYEDQLQILNYFVRLMINIGKEVIEQADVIVPVAMHKYKLLKRGYNQAALLAMKIAQKEKKKYLPKLLLKVKNITAQADLKKEQRLKNVQNAFKLNSEYAEAIKGKRVLLIDDVITTGATISECCKVIAKAKPAKIFILTIAKRV